MMLAICAYNRSSDLADHQRGRFFEFEQTYPITPGNDYVVFGFGIWEAILCVLVEDDNGLPNWYPIGLFEMTPQTLPPDWSFSLFDGIRLSGNQSWTQWFARWGYNELVNDEDHSDALQDRDPDALRIFRREVARAREQDSDQDF